MRLLLILMLIISTEILAQRKRKILFDADISTPVDSGFYGVGVVDNQPYLINHRKDSVKFKMEYPYVRALSTGNSKNITLTKKNHLVFCLTDSITLTLPNPADTSNRYTSYNIYFMGWRGGTGINAFKPPDATFRLAFSDSIFFYYSSNKITYRTKVFDHLATNSWFRLSEGRRLTLEILNNKWYLTLNDFEY